MQPLGLQQRSEGGGCQACVHCVCCCGCTMRLAASMHVFCVLSAACGAPHAGMFHAMEVCLPLTAVCW